MIPAHLVVSLLFLSATNVPQGWGFSWRTQATGRKCNGLHQALILHLAVRLHEPSSRLSSEDVCKIKWDKYFFFEKKKKERLNCESIFLEINSHLLLYSLIVRTCAHVYSCPTCSERYISASTAVVIPLHTLQHNHGHSTTFPTC